jgi:hypothetical protein
MSENAPPIAGLTHDGLDALLKRAIRNALIAGAAGSLALAAGAGWATGALFLSGALVSAAGIFEWRRVVRLINSRIESRIESRTDSRTGADNTSRGTAVAFVSLLLRLIFFGVVIYVSLKCFQGSPIALVCGLSLAVVTLTWEALCLPRG